MLMLSLLRSRISDLRIARLDPDDYLTKDEGIRRVNQRLSGDDPYWWILAGGIHVPGYVGAVQEGFDPARGGARRW